MKKSLILSVVVAILMASCGGSSGSAGENKGNTENAAKSPSKLDISGLGSVDDVFPSPGELISALGKLGQNVAWNKLAVYSPKADYSSKEHKSLNLGVRVADAFIAVRAEDKPNLQTQSEAITKLSEGLGASAIAKPFKDKVDKLISESNWKELRTMMDNMYFQLQPQAPDAGRGDQTISALTAAGSLLEGLSAISTQLSQNYSKDGSSLLNQGGLLEDCIDKINKLGVSNSLVSEVKSGMQSILSTLGGTNVENISQDQASKISGVAKSLIQKIVAAQ